MSKLLPLLPIVVAMLSGCVVVPVEPRSAYYDGDPVYVAPAPVWVRPYYGHRYFRHHRYWR